MIGLVVNLRDPEKCPHALCNGETRVINKRHRARWGVIWRRHECLACARRWTSFQSLVHPRIVDPYDVDPMLLKHKQ